MGIPYWLALEAQGISAQAQWVSGGALWEETLRRLARGSSCEEKVEMGKRSKRVTRRRGRRGRRAPETHAGLVPAPEAALEHPGDQRTMQGQVQGRDASAPVQDSVPERLSSYPF